MNITIIVTLVLLASTRADATCSAENVINGTKPSYLRGRRALVNLFNNVDRLTDQALVHLRINVLNIYRRSRRKSKNVILNVC